MTLLTTILAVLLNSVLPSPAGTGQDEGAAFKARYERQVKAVGATGPGVEVILDKWEQACPNDPDMFEARFNLCFNKASKTTVIPLDQERYLGKKPLLSLPDTTAKSGKKNYFEDTEFDPELFSAATRAIDKAISLRPNELRYRFDKISALIAYEKESPDMATEDLRTLIDYDASASPEWTLDGNKVGKDLFNAAIQEYCFSFFRTASAKSYESFREISEKMLSYNPGDPVFMDNVGSWWLVVRRNDKQALKWYRKVLKKAPDDYTAVKNIIIIARNSKDLGLEKKYLPKLMAITPDEAEKAACQVRLDTIKKKK